MVLGDAASISETVRSYCNVLQAMFLNKILIKKKQIKKTLTLIFVHPKGIKFGQMTSLNPIFHVVMLI